jgi:hypothetical protein
MKADSVLAEEDLYDLEVQVMEPQNGKISGQVTGLASNKKLPDNFKLIIGNSPASGIFTSILYRPGYKLSYRSV